MQEDIIKLNEYIEYVESIIADEKDGDKKIDLIKTLATLLNAKILASHKGSYGAGAATATAPAPAQNASITFAEAQSRTNTTCDKCGQGMMSIRMAKSGPRAGKSFLGCSNYKGGCKNTINIEG